MKTIFITVILLAMAVLFLGVKVLFVKNGKFPSGHVHDIQALRKRNITCGKEDK